MDCLQETLPSWDNMSLNGCLRIQIDSLRVGRFHQARPSRNNFPLTKCHTFLDQSDRHTDRAFLKALHKSFVTLHYIQMQNISFQDFFRSSASWQVQMSNDSTLLDVVPFPWVSHIHPPSFSPYISFCLGLPLHSFLHYLSLFSSSFFLTLQGHFMEWLGSNRKSLRNRTFMRHLFW